MPFDGITDWRSVADRLKKYGFYGELTLELTRNSKPNRNTHDVYKDLDADGFLCLAREKAAELRQMLSV